MAWSSTSRIALRASKPIQARASWAWECVGTNVKPSSAFAGKRVSIGPLDS